MHKSIRRLSEELGASKDTIHRIARLRHLENHTETVDLYFMNWHLNRLNVEWISVVSLSVIPWMIHLSGELLHVMDASKQWIGPSVARSPWTCQITVKKIGSAQSNVVCLVEFWRCDSLGFCSKRACSRCGTYSNHLERVYEILRRRYPALASRIEFSCSRTTRDLILHEQPRQKFRKWEESNCYHNQHTALILRLQITICFDSWPISCMGDI